jgi:hypothetical protein
MLVYMMPKLLSNAVIKITIISFYFCSAEWSLNTEWSLNRPALLSSISIV